MKHILSKFWLILIWEIARSGNNILENQNINICLALLNTQIGNKYQEDIFNVLFNTKNLYICG